MKGMIFAAGLGTRLKPLTDSIPKALAPVGSGTALEFAIRKLKHAGINEIVVNVHHFHEQVTAYLAAHQNFGAAITVSDESDVLLDTGGGLIKAAPLLLGSEPVVVYNCDIISDINLPAMAAYHKEQNALATLAVRSRETSRYFLFNKAMTLCGWKNKKSGEVKIVRSGDEVLHEYAFSGIHIVSPELFPLMPPVSVYSIVSFYLSIAESHTLCGYNHTNDTWMDIGKPETLLDAQKLQLENFF